MGKSAAHVRKCIMSGTTTDGDDGEIAIKGEWSNVQSAFVVQRAAPGSNPLKTVATAGNTAGSVGLTIASTVTGHSSLAVAGAIAAGAAVSATGIGLVVAGAALTLASMATNATAMYSTTKHVIALKKIAGNPGKFRACKCMNYSLVTPDMSHDHGSISKIVLPYIISQKTEKAVKKGIGTAGGGLLTNVYRLGRYAFKADRGKKRTLYAQVLTRHLITHDCALAGAIVAELFGDVEEMLRLRMFESKLSGPVIAAKMKSV
jgi:hypothetical protein